MHIRTNFVSLFLIGEGETEGKRKIKGTIRDLEMERGCTSSSDPFLSEQLTLFGMQSIVSGTCFKNKKTAGSSWRNRVMAQRRAGRKLCTHYPHTFPSLTSFLFHCLSLAFPENESTPDHGEKAHLFLQLLHCQQFPFCLGQTPTYTREAAEVWPGVIQARSVHPVITDRIGMRRGRMCCSD